MVDFSLINETERCRLRDAEYNELSFTRHYNLCIDINERKGTSEIYDWVTPRIEQGVDDIERCMDRPMFNKVRYDGINGGKIFLDREVRSYPTTECADAQRSFSKTAGVKSVRNQAKNRWRDAVRDKIADRLRWNFGPIEFLRFVDEPRDRGCAKLNDFPAAYACTVTGRGCVEVDICPFSSRRASDGMCLP
ncbi:MAG: hypothetical protein AAF748_03505 [Pseudomonadota bacterium]